MKTLDTTSRLRRTMMRHLVFGGLVFSPLIAGAAGPPVLTRDPGDDLTSPDTVTLTATLPDTDPVISVEFFLDGKLLETDFVAPFTALWEEVAAGDYLIFARSTYAGNIVHESMAMPVSVAPPPAPTVTVDILNPRTRGAVAITVEPFVGRNNTDEIIFITVEVEDANRAATVPSEFQEIYPEPGVPEEIKNLPNGSYQARAVVEYFNDDTVTSEWTTLAIGRLQVELVAKPRRKSVKPGAVIRLNAQVMGSPNAGRFRYRDDVELFVDGRFRAIKSGPRSKFRVKAPDSGRVRMEVRAVMKLPDPFADRGDEAEWRRSYRSNVIRRVVRP